MGNNHNTQSQSDINVPTCTISSKQLLGEVQNLKNYYQADLLIVTYHQDGSRWRKSHGDLIPASLPTEPFGDHKPEQTS